MKTKHPIVAITGKARSGKDTFADILIENHGFTKVGFADKLKEAAFALDPLIPNSEGDFPTHIRLSSLVSSIGWENAKDEYPEVRAILQRLGTEAGWQIHGERLWVDAAAKTIDTLPEGKPVVIPDLRFPAERDWAKEVGATVVLIKRENVEQVLGPNAAHASEKGVGLVDQIIDNNDGLDDLVKKAARLVSSLELTSTLS